MTPQQFQSLLLPGAKLVAFIVDPAKMRDLQERTHRAQERTLKLKKIDTRRLHQQIVTI